VNNKLTKRKRKRPELNDPHEVKKTTETSVYQA